MVRNLVVGADIGGTNVKYVLVDEAGRRLVQDDIATDPQDPSGTIDRLASAVAGHLSATERPAGVGLACAGIVTTATGRLGRSPNLPGWESSDLRGAVVAAFGAVPVAVANDVNAALYGEYQFGAGRGCRNLVMIAMGTGVGGGVLVDGQLVTGQTDGAGEVGHMTLALDGPLCPCGNQGCLEAYCGSVGMLRRAREMAEEPGATEAWVAMVRRHADNLSTRHCYELAVTGDTTATAFFRTVGRRLGQAAANLINVLGPDRVIVGGGVAQAGDLVLEPSREMVVRHVLCEEGRRTPVVMAELGVHAAAMGAAALSAGATP